MSFLLVSGVFWMDWEDFTYMLGSVEVTKYAVPGVRGAFPSE